MVFGRPELEGPIIEHGSTRSSRLLHRHRTKIAFWIAVVEALVLVFGPLSRWGALVVAALVLLLYFAARPRLTSPLLRDVLWIAALSQALIALVPLLLIVVGTVAIVAVGVLAVVALVVLFKDRR